MLSPQRFKETKLSGRGNLPEHLAQIWFSSCCEPTKLPQQSRSPHLQHGRARNYTSSGIENSQTANASLRCLVWSVWSTLGLGLSLNTTVRSPPHCEPPLMPAYAENGFFYIWSHMIDLLNLTSLCFVNTLSSPAQRYCGTAPVATNGFKKWLCLYFVSLQAAWKSSSTVSGIDFSHLELSTSSLLQPPAHTAHAC